MKIVLSIVIAIGIAVGFTIATLTNRITYVVERETITSKACQRCGHTSSWSYDEKRAIYRNEKKIWGWPCEK